MRLLIILGILILKMTCSGQGGYEEYAHKKISKKQDKIAKQVVQYWLSQKADSLGIPQDVKLPKLVFSPDEITMSYMDDLMEQKDTISELRKQEYLEAMARGDFYEIWNTYINTVTGKEQNVYYAFTQNLKLKSVTIYEGEYPPIYKAYPKIEPSQVIKD